MPGVQSGPFVNYSATGKKYDLPGTTILKFRNGKLVEPWSRMERLKNLVQLGSLQLSEATWSEDAVR